MCYDERFFLQGATTEARKRQEARSVIERLRAGAPHDRPKPETEKPKEIEPERETV
jgi:hypothetical protein